MNLVTKNRRKVISLSCNNALLSEIDKYMILMGFSNRSELFRTALRKFIADEKEKEKLSGNISAILILIHSHEYENFVTSIKHQSKFSDIIKTQIHHNAGKERCLEMFILEGNSKNITEMLNVFQTSKKISYVKLLPLS
ncbi:MAG: CopG family ribbon-helix-helix protein [Candidatus Helarchaeota archaeon]